MIGFQGLDSKLHVFQLGESDSYLSFLVVGRIGVNLSLFCLSIRKIVCVISQESGSHNFVDVLIIVSQRYLVFFLYQWDLWNRLFFLAD